jgi:hypothetical protein
MPIIIAGIVACGSFGIHVAVDVGAVREARHWVQREVAPTSDDLAQEARELIEEPSPAEWMDR